MNTSDRNLQHQQIYYQTTSQQHSVGIETSMLQSNRREQQIVVLSDNGASVNYHHSLTCECPRCESKSSQGDHHGLYSCSLTTELNDDELDQYTTNNGQGHVVILTKNHGNIDGLSVQERYGLKNKVLTVIDKNINKTEKDALKRAKQAEAARQRYHRLTAEEKKVLNLKRTLAQKRKKQREKEMAQLEAILRASGDIYDDPEVLEQLREKRMRAKWAEAARNRYQRSRKQTMSEEERRSHNMRRRMKQITAKTESGETLMDEETQRRIKEQNEKKAEAARLRYHRMSTDEKKMYNQRRTEAFRRRRMEEEALLAMPIGRINGEALDRAQQIVIRNAKRAEAARLRYQRMTPEQRRAYNQKRYTPKRKRQVMAMILADTTNEEVKITKTEGEEEFDALSSLERDVLRRTQQAQQALLRQRAQQTQQIIGTPTHFIQQPISNSSRSQQQIIVQPSGTQQTGNEVTSQQIQYITTSGNSTGTRILMGGSQSSAHQQVTYVTTASPHQTRA